MASSLLTQLLALLMCVMIPSWVNAENPLPSIDLLDSYFAERESRYPGLIEGAEKNITWASGAGEKTPVSIVSLHGFSATRQEIHPAVALIADNLGANVFYTRLAGHGMGGEALGNVSASDWKRDISEALAVGRLIGDKVVLVGVSTGATLAAYQLAADGRDLMAAVFMSPNFDFADKSAYWLQWSAMRWLTRLIGDDQHSFEPENEAQAKYWTTRYPYEAILPVIELVKEVKTIDKSRLNTPLLIIYSPDDSVVDTGAIEQFFAEYGATEKQLVPFTKPSGPSNHVLAGDIVSPHTTEEIVAMINRFLTSELID